MLTFSDSATIRSETLPAAHLAIEGGNPVRDVPWPTYEKGDVFMSEEDELAAIQAVLRRRYYRYDARKLGETFNGRLEERLCEYFGCRYALACTSGTAAIALALLALDLPPNSPIACSAFTFSATPSAIMLAGHRPVLVDCDENLHVDLSDLKRVIDGGAKAVVVVHMRGFAGDIEAVCKLAAEAGIPVIEDAVPVLGVKSGGRYLGTFGKFGAFSTQADKPINTGEGGFIITDDPDAMHEQLFSVALMKDG